MHVTAVTDAVRLSLRQASGTHCAGAGLPIRADIAWGPCPTYTPHTGGPLHRLLPANRKSATPRRTQYATIEDTMMSANGQHALSDMVELQMYLLAQSQPRPWPLLPRSIKPVLEGREPHRNPVESSAAKELVDGGFVEPTSSRTFVVSKSGYAFYEQEIKPHSE